MSLDDTIDLRRLGENLACEREKIGLTRRQVARFLNIPTAKIAEYERGENSQISITTIERLAELYGHTSDYLWGLKDEDPLPTVGLLNNKSTKRQMEGIAWLNGFILAMFELEELWGHNSTATAGSGGNPMPPPVEGCPSG